MKRIILPVFLAFSVFASSAFAALPAAVTGAFTTVQSDAADLADMVWPAVIAIFGSLVLFKLFKRFGNKI